jgi:hypothetical protein
MPIKAKKLFFWGTGIVLLGTKITTCTKLAMSDTKVASLGTKVSLTDTKFALTCIKVNLTDTRVIMSHDTNKIGLSRTKIRMPGIKIALPGNKLVYRAQTLLGQVLKWHRWAPQLFCHHQIVPYIGHQSYPPVHQICVAGHQN